MGAPSRGARHDSAAWLMVGKDVAATRTSSITPAGCATKGATIAEIVAKTGYRPHPPNSAPRCAPSTSTSAATSTTRAFPGMRAASAAARSQSLAGAGSAGRSPSAAAHAGRRRRSRRGASNRRPGRLHAQVTLSRSGSVVAVPAGTGFSGADGTAWVWVRRRSRWPPAARCCASKPSIIDRASTRKSQAMPYPEGGDRQCRSSVCRGTDRPRRCRVR